MLVRFAQRCGWLTPAGWGQLLLVLVAYGLLGLAYLLATPPLEASDEYKHYPLVQYVQTMGRLPVLSADDPGRWQQEAAQPPLYYLLMAGLTAGMDTGDLPELHQVNKYAFVGDPNQVGNKNLILPRPGGNPFPWQGSVLAIYLIRLVSLLLGAGSVLLTARLGVLLAGQRVGLLAAAFTAFNPMFLFVHAAVNNDSLAILLGSLGLYLLVRLWRDAPEPRAGWARYAGLGLVLGLGLLTKLSLGGLLGLAGLVLALLAWQRRAWRFLLGGGLLLLLPALILPAGWLWRNWQLYGDFTGLNVFIAVQGTRSAPITWSDWVGEFGTFYRSFWGLFGGVNVAAPQWVYGLANGLAVVGAVGLGVWLWRERGRWRAAVLASGLWLLLAWALLLLALLLRWNLISPAFQGRLLFPALAALNVLGALGWLALCPAGWQRRVAYGLAGGALLLAAWLPWGVIRPAYALPQPLAGVPAGAAFGPIDFYVAGEPALQLVGVELLPDQRVVPGGQPVVVTLYWRAARPVAADYLSAVGLLGRDYVLVGQVNRHPAGGQIPTSRWQPGQVWRDEYHVFPRAGAAAPTRLRVRASLYDPQAGADLPAAGVDGVPIDLLLVGEAVLANPAGPPTPSQPLAVALAEGISLLGYDAPARARPGDRLPVLLYWQAAGMPAQDYTVFVQLLDPAGVQVAGADGPPVNGDYPTGLWRAGDWVDDLHWLALPEGVPAGGYTIAVGLYDPQSGRRVPRLDGQGDAIQWPLLVEP